jgi:predicted type IV restriction endonuclease
MLFNFFNRKKHGEKENSTEEILAKITYVANNESDTPIVDVEIKEYNDECIEALSMILNTIGEERAYVQTVEIIKNYMMQDHQESYLIKILTNLSEKAKNKIINVANKKESDEICIKPSEMMF